VDSIAGCGSEEGFEDLTRNGKQEGRAIEVAVAVDDLAWGKAHVAGIPPGCELLWPQGLMETTKEEHPPNEEGDLRDRVLECVRLDAAL
jgi:hypothetical protein